MDKQNVVHILIMEYNTALKRKKILRYPESG